MSFSRIRQALRPRALSSGWMGVTSESSRLTAAIVQRRQSGKPRLCAMQTFDGELSAKALSAWSRQQGHRGMRTNFLLGQAEYQILPIEAPDVALQERASAARWRIKDMIEFPVDDACVECLLVPDAPGSARMPQALAVVSQRQTVAQWLKHLREQGSEPTAMDIPELAVRNLASLLPGSGTVALLHIGLSRTLLVMVWQGELCSSRRFDLHASQLLAASPETREQLIERLGLDVQRTADAFERQFQAAALSGLWVTEAHEALSISDELGRFVGLPVKPFQLHEHLDFDTDIPLLDPAQHIDYVMAIGAALREESP
jgi:MSHA biogenesis protein MshI